MITVLFEKKHAEYIRAIESQYYELWYHTDHANKTSDPAYCDIPF